MALLYDWLTASARERGNARALIHRDTYLSWRGLLHRVDRRAQELRSFGIHEGEWVGMMLGNVPEFVVLSLALTKLGAVVVPIDPTTSPRDLDMVLDAAPLRALVTRPHGETNTAVNFEKATRTHVSRFVPEGRKRIQGTLLNCNMFKRDPAPELGGLPSPVTVHFTTDTGGDSKGVVRTETQLAAIATTLGAGLNLAAGEQILAVAPFCHSYGFDVALLVGLAHGLTLVLEDEVSSRHLVRTLREETFALMPGTPALYGMLARVPSMQASKPRNAHYLCSGAVLPRTVSAAFVQRFGVRPRACYHSTQTGPVTLDRDGGSPATVGTPLPGVEVRVMTADGTRLKAGTTGQVWVRGAGVATASVPKLPVPIRGVGRVGIPIGRADADGWLRTGDLGAFDGEGRLTLDGREDDLVRIDGKRVALGEVASCVEGFAQVRMAEARVIYDDVRGPLVIARVVRAGDCRAEDIIEHCARLLAPHKVPTAIEFCSEL